METKIEINSPILPLEIETNPNIKSKIRSRQTFYCSVCNKNFDSIAVTRAKCPTCNRKTSIMLTSDNAEKYRPKDNDDISNKMVLEPSFIFKNEPSISIISKEKPNVEIENRKILELKPEHFSDMVELFNKGAKLRGIQEISTQELDELFLTFNEYFKENKIFESMGKTGVTGIILKISGMIIDRLIPILIQHYAKNKGELMENGTRLESKDNSIDYEKISIMVSEKMLPIIQKQIGDILEKKT